jgi:2-methylcitrate dehydratase PrpD
MEILKKLSEWAVEIQYKNLSPNAIDLCKRSINDTCAVTVAGSTHYLSNIIRNYAKRQLLPGLSVILGTNETASAPAAAFANAFAAHVWDFDDTCYSGIVHPSTVIFPAVLGIGEELSSSGRDIITAYIAGLEIQGKLGESVTPQLFMKGWFTTSILGIVGAATAVSKLLKLDSKGICNAIGLGFCQAGGMRQNNGTAAKPYTVARAAETGIHAAILAKHGISASHDIIEGPEGFMQTYCNNQYDKKAFESLGEPLIINSPGIALKPYPTCSGTHAAMDAVLSIINENGINWKQIKHVLCKTTPVAVRSLKYNNPVTVEQAQFSMPYCIACVIRYGKFEISQLSLESLNDQDVKRIMNIIEMVPIESFENQGKTSKECPEGAETTVYTLDGKTYQKFIGHAKGSPSNPFSMKDQWNKFATCTNKALGEKKSKLCFEHINNFESLKTIKQLTQFMACDFK